MSQRPERWWRRREQDRSLGAHLNCAVSGISLSIWVNQVGGNALSCDGSERVIMRRDPETRRRHNRVVKQRETFRPFAATEYFHIRPRDEWQFGHMLIVAPVQEEHRTLPGV